MKRRHGALALVAVFAAGLSSLTAHAGYVLVWSDEFEGAGISSENWTRRVMPGADSGNQELACYTERPENAYLENGCLVIEARKESYEGHDYTSARLTSRGKQDFRYGRIEARIRLPKGQGVWPALWMLPTDNVYGTWAASGEIDIMESVNQADQVFGTIHFGGEWPHNVYQGDLYRGAGGAQLDLSADFHVYALEWQPYEMRWYVDGQLYAVQDQWRSTGAPYPAPFDQPFHIILNLAIGGTLPGPPDASTPWPQRMYVDWVRVLQTENRPPEMDLLAPADGTRNPAGEPIVVQAAVRDPDGETPRMVVYEGDRKLGEVAGPPYRFSWDAPDGLYRLRVKAIDGEDFVRTREVEVVQGGGTPRAPYPRGAHALPGTVEAEDFDQGMPGDAYQDTDRINHGNQYRPECPVDIEHCGEGGYNVGWFEPGEWLAYTVDVTQAGDYDLVFRTASVQGEGRFRLEVDGDDRTGPLATPGTGSWQRYTNVLSGPVSLGAGRHVFRFVVEAGQFNLNRFQVLPAGVGGRRAGPAVDPLDYVRAAAGDGLDEACFLEKVQWFWDQCHGQLLPEWEALRGISDNVSDLDADGVPDGLEVALVAAAICMDRGADAALVRNHDAFAKLYGQGPFWGKPVPLAFLSLTGPGGVGLIHGWDARTRELAIGPYERDGETGPSPLAPEGDLDGDGFSNRVEYERLHAPG